MMFKPDWDLSSDWSRVWTEKSSAHFLYRCCLTHCIPPALCEPYLPWSAQLSSQLHTNQLPMIHIKNNNKLFSQIIARSFYFCWNEPLRENLGRDRDGKDQNRVNNLWLRDSEAHEILHKNTWIWSRNRPFSPISNLSAVQSKNSVKGNQVVFQTWDPLFGLFLLPWMLPDLLSISGILDLHLRFTVSAFFSVFKPIPSFIKVMALVPFLALNPTSINYFHIKSLSISVLYELNEWATKPLWEYS